MTTTQDMLPTTTPDIDDILRLIPQLTTSQQRYVLAYAKCGTTQAAYAEAGIDADTVATWRAPSRDPEQRLRRIEAMIEQHRGAISVAMARQHLQHHAIASAERLTDTATREPLSARERQVGLSAQTTLLEAVGVIQRTPAAVLQVNQVQGADPAVLRRLVEALEDQRQAIAAEQERRRLHNSTQSPQSALSEPAPDTLVDNK